MPANNHLPRATLALVVAAAWTYVWQLSLGADGAERASYVFGVTPAVLTSRASLPLELAVLPPPATLLSSVFVHPSGLIAAVNLVCIWILGQVLEVALRPMRLAALFFCAGFFGSLWSVISNPLATTPLIGADAAVSGLFGAFLVLHPTGTVGLFRRSRARLPVLMALAAWIVWQYFGPGLYAWSAHAIALIVGAVVMLFLMQAPARLFD